MGEGFGGRCVGVARALLKRPWLLLSWLVLAALTVGAQKIVTSPWSAAVYPVALLIALWLFSRATAEKS